jgi:hypothetical protein
MVSFSSRLICIIAILTYSQISISQPDCLVPLRDPAKPCNLELIGDRLTVNLDPEEVQQSKSELIGVTKGNVPTSMQGGLVFDAYMMHKKNDRVPGQAVWTLRATHIYAGKASAFRDNKIEVVSPNAQTGGAIFLSDRRYRVFAIELHGRLYVWDATIVQIK